MEHFVCKKKHGVLYPGTPVFSKCNTSSCEETHCVSSYNIQITLDLRIVYINSVSMTAGPDPNSISLSKVDNGVNTLIMTCRDLGSSRLPCDIFDNRFDFVGDFPHNISFVILSADSDTGGIYNATAPVTEPSGNSRTLIKTISGTLLRLMVIILLANILGRGQPKYSWLP